MLHCDFIPDKIWFTPKSDQINKNLFKEWIETNDKQLLTIDSLYQQIKKFILHDLTPEQIRILSRYKSNRLFGTDTFKNDVIKNNIALTNKYLNRYNKTVDGYEFVTKTNCNEFPLLSICIAKINDSIKANAAYDDGKNSNGKKLYVFCIENIFDLSTVKTVLDSKFNIVHELTHFLDDINHKGLYGNVKAYYNDPDEIHAFIQMMLSWLKEYLDSFEGLNKFYRIKKSDLTPDKIREILDNYLKNSDNDNTAFFYTVRDYNRMILQKHFEQMPENVKKKIYSKLAEELQTMIKEEVIDFNVLTCLQESLPL